MCLNRSIFYCSFVGLLRIMRVMVADWCIFVVVAMVIVVTMAIRVVLWQFTACAQLLRFVWSVGLMNTTRAVTKSLIWGRRDGHHSLTRAGAPWRSRSCCSDAGTESATSGSCLHATTHAKSDRGRLYLRHTYHRFKAHKPHMFSSRYLVAMHSHTHSHTHALTPPTH